MKDTNIHKNGEVVNQWGSRGNKNNSVSRRKLKEKKRENTKSIGKGIVIMKSDSRHLRILRN